MMKKIITTFCTLFYIVTQAQQAIPLADLTPLNSNPIEYRAACQTLNEPVPSSWTATNYYVGGGAVGQNGWINGLNSNGDKEKASFYDVSATAFTHLQGFKIRFGKIYSANPNKVITFKVYDGTLNQPGSMIGSRAITIGALMSGSQFGNFAEIIFKPAIQLPVSKKFFISVDVTGLSLSSVPKDTLSILSNTSPQTNPTTTWEKKSNNTWYQYNNAASYQLNIALYIFPYVATGSNVTSFTQNPPSGQSICAGKSVSFDASASTAAIILWDFPGGTPNSGGNPTETITYNTAGTYTVTLVTSGSICPIIDSAFSTVTVLASPAVTTSANPTTICVGSSSTLSASSGSGTTFTWSPAGSLSSPNGSPVTATPTSTTNYTVVANGTNGCSTTKNVNIIVNPKPTAVVNISSKNICIGQSVTFNGSASQNTSSFTWAFAGGTPPNAYTAAPSVTYNNPGTFAAKLKAVNNCGIDSSFIDSIKVGCVGINEEIESNYTITHNSSQLTIGCNTVPSDLKTTAILFNLVGQEITSVNINKQITNIPISELNNGIYFVRIVQNNNVLITRKFLKG